MHIKINTICWFKIKCRMRYWLLCITDVVIKQTGIESNHFLISSVSEEFSDFLVEEGPLQLTFSYMLLSVFVKPQFLPLHCCSCRACMFMLDIQPQTRLWCSAQMETFVVCTLTFSDTTTCVSKLTYQHIYLYIITYYIIQWK